MSLHERLADLLWAGLLERRVAERVALRVADHAHRDELTALSAEVARLSEVVATIEQRVAAANANLEGPSELAAGLARKLAMASAAVQSVEERVGGASERLARAEAVAGQARQQATSARATAESVADGVAAWEESFRRPGGA
jgi:hypothetical protein